MKIDESIRSFVRSVALRFRLSYTRALEEEVARLRVENRALINSILGVAGIPPMRAAAVARASARANLCSSGPVAAPSAATDLRPSAVSASDLRDSGSASRQSRRIRGTGRELHHSAPPCADVPLRSIRRLVRRLPAQAGASGQLVGRVSLLHRHDAGIGRRRVLSVRVFGRHKRVW